MCVHHLVHKVQGQRLAGKSGENAFAACIRPVNQTHDPTLAPCLFRPLWNAEKTRM